MLCREQPPFSAVYTSVHGAELTSAQCLWQLHGHQLRNTFDVGKMALEACNTTPFKKHSGMAMHAAHTAYGLSCVCFDHISLTTQSTMPPHRKEQIMSPQTLIASPTPAEINKFIDQAHKMRADYIAQSVSSGLARLRSLFSHNSGTKSATT